MKKKTQQLLIVMLFIQFILILGSSPVTLADAFKVTGGTASASCESSTAYKAFDSDYSTNWSCGGYGSESPPAVSLKYQLPSAKIVTRYKIFGLSASSYELQGSNDGSAWTPLPIQSQEGGYMLISNSTAYSYYRIRGYGLITGSQVLPPYNIPVIFWEMSVAELELFTDPCNPTGTLDGLYECTGAIVTDGTVESGTSAILSSSQSITLSPGFWAKSGSTFSANLALDSDSDDLPDIWEITQFGTINYDESDDPDNDGLTNLQEYQLGTSPTDPDTDGDGMPDGWEVQYGLKPLVDDADGDLDGDGISNLMEFNLNYDPTESNSGGIFYDYDAYGRIKSKTVIH